MVSFRFKFQILFCDKLIYKIKGHSFQPKYVKFNFGSHGASWIKKVPESFTGNVSERQHVLANRYELSFIFPIHN